MLLKQILDGLNDVLKTTQVRTQVPLCDYTTFQVGGPAEILIAPDERDLVEALKFCVENNVQYTVLGHGSNVLVSDKGIKGVVIIVGKAMSEVLVSGTMIIAKGGALLSAVARSAVGNSLTGFEFAAGIPGTIGGACVMNAGAYDGEMKNVLKSVRVFDPSDCKVKDVSAKDLDLSYRHSIILEKDWIVIEATIELSQGDVTEIQDKMNDLAKRRREKQPLEYPSAGSTFKRPEGYFAGQLIQEAKLRGYCVGDAQISDKHCGFVINRGNAVAADIYDLINEVIERVEEVHGVTLEPEVKLIGEF